MDRNRLTLPLLGLFAAMLACGAPAPTATPSPPPTLTPYPKPLPPAATPQSLPQDQGLQELIRYARNLSPILSDAGAILARDGAILKETEGGNDAPFCDGRLAADKLAMQNILAGVSLIEPPQSASAIHDLVEGSALAYSEALSEIEQFCHSGNALHKIPAALKFAEASLLFQDAGNRFWLLLISQRVEDWVQR